MATPTNKSKDLPQDIITDILTRLPVKSLMRFKCVCKHWNQLITKSRFPFWVLDRYLDCNHSETNCSHREPNIIIVSNKRCQYGHQDGEPNAKIFCIGGAAKEDSFKIATEITDDPFEIKTNACDGMLCLVSEDQNLLLWNPATREHKALPLPISDGRAFCRGVCGLGLDDSIDDYKVVSLFNGEIYVFSVKRNVWKVAGAFKNWICDEPVAANGCLYWIAGKGFGFSEKLLCLDLSNDKYWEVPLPLLDQPNTRSPRRGPNGSHRCDLTLFLSGRNLCMFRGRDHAIWMLEVAKEAEEQKENHDGGGDAEMVERESWRKLMVLPKLQIQENEDNPILEQGFSKLSPKCFTNSGKLVICTNYFKLVMYNPEDGSYEDLEIPGLGRGLWKRVIPYVESLIAPTSIRGLNDID